MPDLDIQPLIPATPALAGQLAQPITTLHAESPLSAALAALTDSPSGAVIAEGGGELVGILTERNAVDLTLAGQQSERRLGEVCSQALLWAETAEPYVAVYERMLSRGVRHAIVRDSEGAAVGILSESAILRHMGVEHFAHLDALEQIMTPSPAALPASASVPQCLALIRREKIGCVILVDEHQRPAGIITTRDITRLLSRGVALDTLDLAQVMSAPVICLDASRPAFEAARLMAERKIRHIVITRGETLVGILSEHDIVRCLEHRYVEVLRHMIERQADEIEAHRQLAAQGNLLDQLLTRTRALGVCLIEAGGAIRVINHAARELLGMDDQQPIDDITRIAPALAADERTTLDNLLSADPATGPCTVTIGARKVLIRAHRFSTRADDAAPATLLILVDQTVADEAGEMLGFSRHAFGAMDLPMLWVSTNGKVALANPAFNTLLGIAPETAVSLDLHQLFDNASELLQPADTPPAGLRQRHRLHCPDGRSLPVLLFFSQMSFRGERYLGGFIHDLSDQDKIERALHDSEQRLGALLETTPDFIAIKDPDSRWLMANRAGLKMYRLGDVPWQGLDNEGLAAHVPATLKDVLERCTNTDKLAWGRASSVRFIEELPHSEDDGSRYLDMIKTPLFDAAGRPKALMVIGRDVTERMRAERARHESDGRLRSALASMDDLMLITDSAGVVRDHYPKPAPGRFHFDGGPLIGQPMSSLLPPDAGPRFEQALERLANAGSVQSFDYCVGDEADSAWFNVRMSRHGHLENGRFGATLIVRDITTSKQDTAALARLSEQLELRVAERTAELQSALTELESFSNSLSHDLRTPLRAIDGFSTLLASDMAEHLPDEGKDHLRRIQCAVERMSTLIDSMLDLSHLSRKPLQREALDLSQMARDILEELSGRDPHRSVDWQIEDGMSARADRQLMHSVLDNLLGNAWKFTRHASAAQIRFGTHIEHGVRQFVVADNGAGFDMQEAGRLFQPFQRLHPADQFEGTGIGLATVQRIVMRHGGQVTAQSAHPQGTRFTFTLGD
ncbi:MAG: CBS domain-containing protein [Rhodocyclaceae bacterium]|nr:CBS domain-containing protein [Rhodocyclaceae bacterium]